MTRPEIVLLGYYGRMNFGDDILMAVAWRIAAQIMPGAGRAIRSGTDLDYPARLLGEAVPRIGFGTRDRHELILHGGGGTFFDFAAHSLARRLRNGLVLAAGAGPYVRAEGALRRAVGRPRMSARRRIGLGIGVGSYSAGSSRLLEALPVLAEFDALWLRDRASAAALGRLGVAPPVVAGSDLAFLHEHWCPEPLLLAPRPRHGGRPRLGVILRDWPGGSGAAFGQRLRPMLERVSGRCDLTLFALDPGTDAGTLRALGGLERRVWRPDRHGLAEFLGALAGQDAFVTARAHGAICGACLGRPSVILEIEPKLRAVHGMLPNATRLAAVDSDAAALGALVEEVLEIPADAIARDVEANRALSRRALGAVMARCAG